MIRASVSVFPEDFITRAITTLPSTEISASTGITAPGGTVALGTEVGEGIPYGVIDALMSARRGYGVSPEREIGGQYFERASVSAGASPPTMRTRIAQRSPGG